MSMPGDPAAASETAWIGEVLRFWFEELAPDAWFKRDDAVDQVIRQRFFGLLTEIAARPPDPAPATARHALATVIVLDQFARNMFRGTAAAFANDPAAIRVSKSALARGDDLTLDTYGRLFLYLPFEHSEDAADQVRSLALIGALGDPQLTGFAEAHKRIIDRFGRFPHRNQALGRLSTPEELAFLSGPNSSF